MMNVFCKLCCLLLTISVVVIQGRHVRSFDPSSRSVPTIPLESLLNSDLVTFKKKPKPTPGTAPLDLNELINGELNTVTQILGVVTGGLSGLVGGLTGISITDCATQIKGKDFNSMTCAEFLNELSKCDSLKNLKDLIQAAKKRYRKNPNSKKPCFR